ncbi:NAD(P)H-binding protein [Saccharothrix sp. S26]|uniref:NAD(P)H-binding protein n=1 Tax=Saccharothrix sp. S26 TaxID=2907215 RepID=UPI001F1BC8B4|nr:NAD(P)H-binding protein [Saccharothrix sp. S26]MCE6997990.1 NAD(P)H-binding protein [Saccharothrix sp. S26]
MLLITGATGTTGREVVRLLTDRGVPFRAMSRTPTGDQVHGDHTDPASLDRAAEGVDAVFLLGPGTADLPAYDLAVLDAAKRAGVPKVVKLSSIPVGPVAEWHRPGEEASRAFPAWTLLRASLFATNSLQWAPLIAAGEPIPNPMGTTRLGVVDPRDLAEVAVRALLDDHHGRTYTLTGPHLLNVSEQVAVLSDVLGRELSTVDVPLDVLPPEYAEGVRAVRSGGGSLLSDDVARVLGRPARDYATWARENFPRA